MKKLNSFQMEQNEDRSYTCEIDISNLKDRNGTIVVETIDDSKKNNRLGAFITKALENSVCKIDEISGELSLQAHEDFGKYIDLLGKRDNIAIFIAACGDFMTSAYEKDLNDKDKIIQEKERINKFYCKLYKSN